MPKKTPKPRSQQTENDPVVLAAGVAQRGVSKAAMITAAGAVLVAVIGGAWQWLSKSPLSTTEKSKLVIKVIDKSNNKAVGGAMVSMEGNGDVPLTDSTDSEGVISFPINDPKKELRVRVSADGYTTLNIRLTPVNITGVQEIRLTSSQPPFTPPTSSSPSPTSTPNDTTGEKKNEGVSSSAKGRVIDANTGESIFEAKVSIVGYGQENTLTGRGGEFELPLRSTQAQKFRLRVEKEGYSSTEQWHELGGRIATIRLTR